MTLTLKRRSSGEIEETWAMRSLKTRWVQVSALALAIGATGCDNSCEGVYRCPLITAIGGGEGTDGGADPCPEDPAAGEVEERCGIWVAASWGDDKNHGSQAAPVATIAQAIALALEGSKRVYACGELYSEVVTLPSGVSLHGGFTCDGGAWRYQGETHTAIIAPGFPTLASMLLQKGTGSTLVTDVTVEAVDAVDPGGSSIAVMALDSAEATLDRCILVAGDGADGEDGEDGDHNGAPAQPGLPGYPGADACTANPGLGGLAIKLVCDGGDSSGGNGGNGGEAFANDGSLGLQPPDPNPEGYGAGGKAEDAAQGTFCTGGAVGVQGNSGDHGAGGTDWGRLTVDGYIGAPGEDGFPGAPGQGGGGGGGSIGSAICGAAPHGGAGGGSGGTGGCGGRAGKGGQGGGSSFGVVALDARLTLRKIEFLLGSGGDGGNGGALQLGGQGGFPGLGGLGLGGAAGVTAGCHGGAGGQGGNGGNGGGGRGGHSYGYVSTSDEAIFNQGPSHYQLGHHGEGGQGGNPALQGTSGLVGFVGFGAILSP